MTKQLQLLFFTRVQFHELHLAECTVCAAYNQIVAKIATEPVIFLPLMLELKNDKHIQQNTTAQKLKKKSAEDQYVIAVLRYTR